MLGITGTLRWRLVHTGRGASLGRTVSALALLVLVAGVFGLVSPARAGATIGDKPTLTKVLTYHVVSGRLSPDQVAGMHKTLEGSDLNVTGSGQNFQVNGANVVCGNVQTANATVYIVDTVLMPPASCRLNPRLRASRPTIPPAARANSGLKLAPNARPAGSAVAVSPSRYPGLVTPRLASLIKSA